MYLNPTLSAVKQEKLRQLEREHANTTIELKFAQMKRLSNPRRCLELEEKLESLSCLILALHE